MLNLMKYEFLRRKKLMLILLIALVIAEALVLLGINQGGRLLGIAVILIFVMIFGTTILIFADSIRTYSADLNQKPGYMLFMTPNSGYKIIGSKMIINFITLIVFSSFIFALMYLNFLYAKAIYFEEFSGPLKEITSALSQIYGDAIPGVFTIFMVFGTQLLEAFGYIMMAMFALTMRKTIFAQTRYGGILSFIIFIVIYGIMQTINFGIFTVFSFFSDYMEGIEQMVATETFDSAIYFDIIRNFIVVSVVLWLGYIGAFFGISGRLINKRIDL